MSWFNSGLTVVVAAGLALLAAPARAHCGDYCDEPLPYFALHASDVVAVDGVLGFAFDYGRGATALEFLSVTVRDAEGTEVAGTMTANEAFSVLIWRPDVPWVTGAKYTVATKLDTAGWAGALYGAPANACTTYEVISEITIDAAPLPAPEAASIVVTTEYERRPGMDVDSVVCCDGAMPSMWDGPGSCPSKELQRGYGHCLTRLDRGRLSVEHAVDREALASAVAGNFVVRVLNTKGFVLTNPRLWLSAPTCLQFESLDLARGDVFVEERCLGEDVELGDLEVDPSASIAKLCEGPAYVCEVLQHSRWDPDECKTWPDGADYEYIEPTPEPAPEADAESMAAGDAADAEAGCGCAQSGPRAAPLVLLALGLIGRRRRRA